MPVTEGLTITELDSLVEQDGTELIVLVSDPSGTSIDKKVAADYRPVRAQIMFTVPGTLVVSSDAAPWFACNVPGGLQLLGTALAAKTAPTGTAIIVDIECSCDGGITWGSIYLAQPTLSDNYNTSGTLCVTHISQGDILRSAINQVGSTVAGADLTISLWVRQGGTGVGCVTTSTSTTTLTSSSTSSSTTTSLCWQSPDSVYLSCGEHAAGPDDYIIDGNVNSCWLHLSNEDHDIVFDLGAPKYVEKIRLYVYNQDVSQWCFFQAYLSDDLEDWGSPIVPSGSFEDGTYGAEWIEQEFTIGKTGRYLWLTLIDTTDTLDHVMGAEFEIYATCT